LIAEEYENDLVLSRPSREILGMGLIGLMGVLFASLAKWRILG
jgi:hypothetical protein